MSKGEHMVQIRQNQAAQNQPDTSSLFFASLAACAFVYVASALAMAALTFVTDPMGRWSATLSVLGVSLQLGLFALFFAIMIAAPLGTAIGHLVFRLTPHGLWQGALTGAITAAAFEAPLIWFSRGPLDKGTLVMLAIPFGCAVLGGALVQRFILSPKVVV